MKIGKFKLNSNVITARSRTRTELTERKRPQGVKIHGEIQASKGGLEGSRCMHKYTRVQATNYIMI